MKLARRFLQVGSRRVHYLRAGSGPPVVLVHSSPANAMLLLPEIRQLAGDYTVFAFDTPGFGLSEALPLDTMIVADLADALHETLRAMGMPPCPIYGTHSGAAIALELGVRHPEHATGFVFDGVPAFTDEECQAFFGDYFRKIPASDLGGHYAAVWTRFRDQSTWFPWNGRAPERLNDYDLSPPESTHLWVSMYFQAAETYTPAYTATSHYGARAIAAAAELDLPAIFTATDTDMLFPHMARLGELRQGQEIRHIGRSHAARRALIAEGFARFGSPHAAPADCDAIGTSARVSRQFVHGGAGDIHVRYAGARDRPAVLLLHDAPGSSSVLEPLILALAERFFVVAPDLPGSGESTPLPPGTLAIAHFADEMARLLSAIGIDQAGVFGLGFGSTVAFAMARRWPARFGRVAVCGVALPDASERTRLAAGYTPLIGIEPDGGHWYRTWLMLRDSLIWWPWFERRRETQRRVPANFGADRLHRWTIDVMGSRENYGDLIQAALAHECGADIAALDAAGVAPFLLLGGNATPLTAYDAKLTAMLPRAVTLRIDDAARTLGDRLIEVFA